jgi:hypothetical protein
MLHGISPVNIGCFVIFTQRKHTKELARFILFPADGFLELFFAGSLTHSGRRADQKDQHEETLH